MWDKLSDKAKTIITVISFTTMVIGGTLTVSGFWNKLQSTVQESPKLKREIDSLKIVIKGLNALADTASSPYVTKERYLKEQALDLKDINQLWQGKYPYTTLGVKGVDY